MNIECDYLWEQKLFEERQEVAIAVRAVNIYTDSEYYDQAKLGRYGKNGYSHYIDQATNPEIGEITAIHYGTMEPGEPIELITK